MGSQQPLRQSPKIIAVGLFLVALVSRLTAIGRYVTPDEPIWVFRALRFREALLAGDWANTIQSGHPGVTVTWLGSIAIQLQLWLDPSSRTHLDWLDQIYWLSPDNAEAFRHLSAFLTAARLGPILLTSLGIAALYWLLRTRINPTIAAAGTLLVALDPFTAGLSSLLHLDALLATFMLLALLLILPNPNQTNPPTKRQAIWSGLFTALAILTKTPGLFLLPFIGLLFIWLTLRPNPNNLPISARLRQMISPVLLWAATIALVILLLLPAVWAAPTAVLDTVSGLANRLADSAVRPIFFLGQETLQPGPAFYPLVLAFRLSPVVVIGLVLTAVFAVRTLFVERFGKSLFDNSLFWLLLFSLSFLFFLNLSAKRFDRYALPALLPLIIISAVGLQTAAHKLKNPDLSRLVLPAFATIQLIYFLVALPFPLLAYNWLAGGTAVAQNVFQIGWGEETSQTARQLAAEPDSASRTLYTSNIPAAAAFYPGPILPIETQSLTRLQPTDYVHFVPQDWQLFNNASDQDFSLLTYAVQNFIRSQNVTNFSEAKTFTNLKPSDFTLPTFVSAPQDIHFGEAVAVTSAGALPASWPSDIQIGIEWQPLQTAESDYFYRLELVDQNGEVWLSLENLLLNTAEQPVRYWPAGESQQVFYTILPPSDLAPVEYAIQLSLFDEQGARLGVFRPDGRFGGVTAPIADIIIPAPVAQLPPEIPDAINTNLEVTGYDNLPNRTETGLPLKLDIWWRQADSTPTTVNLQLQIGNETADTPITTASWLRGQVYHLRPIWRVPTALASGSYPLSLQLLDEDGRSLWPAPIQLGQIEVVARPRSFDLPAELTPLELQLGTFALLQEADATVNDSTIDLTVTWQAVEPDGVFYTTFVHLLDGAGSTVTQGDRPSLEPTNIWVAGQVIRETYTLARPSAGTYTIALGLYNQTNGQRLPIYGPNGVQLPNDQFLIEITVP